jgi:predicted transcriptional regulator
MERNCIFTLKVSPKEREKIKALAQSMERTQSDAVRQAINFTLQTLYYEPAQSNQVSEKLCQSPT